MVFSCTYRVRCISRTALSVPEYNELGGVLGSMVKLFFKNAFASVFFDGLLDIEEWSRILKSTRKNTTMNTPLLCFLLIANKKTEKREKEKRQSTTFYPLENVDSQKK